MAAAANAGVEGEWERTAEDDIIAMLHESGATNFCDPAFPPDTTSLYRWDAMAPHHPSRSMASSP